MYRISSSLDLKFLAWESIKKISTGSYQVSLYFSKDICINIEEVFYVSNKREVFSINPQENLDKNIENRELSFFVGKKVLSIEILEDEYVKIVFDEEAAIKLTSKVGMYESFSISSPWSMLVV